jgi:hypothetical protein
MYAAMTMNINPGGAFLSAYTYATALSQAEQDRRDSLEATAQSMNTDPPFWFTIFLFGLPLCALVALGFFIFIYLRRRARHRRESDKIENFR